MQHPCCAPRDVAAVWPCCLPAKCTGYELCHYFITVVVVALFSVSFMDGFSTFFIKVDSDFHYLVTKWLIS